MTIDRETFARLPDGREVSLYTIRNDSGASASITDWGGTLQSLKVPDRAGEMADVVLGFPKAESYIDNTTYIGALIGRVGNRIGCGLCRLNGQPLKLNANSNGQHLHGGNEGFDRRLWTAALRPEAGQLELKYISPDGEENYPGTLDVTVTYALSNDNALTIHYTAVSDKDTLCNLTNHAYFNLSGEGSGQVLDHEVMIAADRFTVTDENLIPTGELRSVEGTPFDLRGGAPLGERLPLWEDDPQMKLAGGYDHNFCLNGEGMREAAWVYSPKSGIRMTVETDQPGVQLYTANGLNGGSPGKCGRAYGRWEGLCLETQNYPDAINHPLFPSPVLRALQRYDTTTVYRFGL